MAGSAQPIDPFFKGETRTFGYTVLDGDKAKATVIDGKTYPGARVDISGATAIEWQAKYPTGAPYTPVVAKSLGAGIVLADQSSAATKGDFVVTLSPADTRTITAKQYRYDVWLVISGQPRYVVRSSLFNVLEPVNDAP